MAVSHFSGPVDSKAGFTVNGTPLVGVVGYGGFDKVIRCGAASVADGGTINTGLSSIDAFFLTAAVAGRIAAGSVSGGTITVSLVNHDGTAVTTPEIVNWIAVGR